MAVEPITPAEQLVPAQPHVDYAKAVGRREKFPDTQSYTIWQIYGMVESALKVAGVPAAVISFPWFIYFFREAINHYSAEVCEFQRMLRHEGGGAVFKIPHLRDIIVVDVNGYNATRVAEQTMISYRAAGEVLSSSTRLYSVNGNLLSVYPDVESDDTITIFAAVYAEDFNEDAANTIIPLADGFALYHGTLYRCLENQQKQFMHEKEEYLSLIASRKSRVARQITPSRVMPHQFVR